MRRKVCNEPKARRRLFTRLMRWRQRTSVANASNDRQTRSRQPHHCRMLRRQAAAAAACRNRRATANHDESRDKLADDRRGCRVCQFLRQSRDASVDCCMFSTIFVAGCKHGQWNGRNGCGRLSTRADAAIVQVYFGRYYRRVSY